MLRSVRANPPLLLRAGLRYQLRHRWQAALALIGIIMGVAVVLAVDLANGAAKASFALSAKQLQGAATHRVVSADGRVPESVYTDLFLTPGHPAMAPVLTAPVRIKGREGRFRLVGLDLFAEGPFRGELPGAISGVASLADWLVRPDAAALSRSAAAYLGSRVGERLEVQSQGRSHTLEVIALSENDSVGSRDLIVVDIATAQAIAGMRGYLSHIDLTVDDGDLATLRDRLPAPLRVVSIADQTRGTVGLSASFELNLTAMSLLALLVGLFLIFNAMSFSIVQRRNLMGRLRALGVRSDELSRLILAEALALALVGTVCGIALGVWLGHGLTQIVAATVSELYYEVTADALQLSGSSLIKAVALGLGGTLVAAWLPARQAARTPPLTTLSRAALERSARSQLPKLALAGALLVLAGLAIAFLIPGGLVAGFAGLFVMIVGAALITPLGLRLIHWLFDRLPGSGVWRMAVRDLDRHLSRLGTAAAALMVALSASVGVAVMVESMRESVSDWLQALLTADLYIAAEGFEDGASLPEAVVSRAAKLPTVTAFSSYRDRTLQIGGRRLELVAARLSSPSRAGFDFTARGTANPWSLFDQGQLLVSEPLAYRLGLAPGDLLRLPTARGDRDFTIAAVFRDFASEHGRMFLDRQAYGRYWPDEAVDTLALFSDQGGTVLLRAADELLSGDRGLVFTEAREIYDASMGVFDRTFRITEVLRLLSLLVAFIGVLTALMAVQLERRKEYAVLRALGLTRRQVSALILIESGALGLLAGLLAVPTGVAMAWVLTEAIQLRAFGWSMPFVVSAGPLWLTVGTGALAALLASIYPAWRSAWSEPAPLLRED
jgi:putative ABC transport system permease protein